MKQMRFLRGRLLIFCLAASNPVLAQSVPISRRLITPAPTFSQSAKRKSGNENTRSAKGFILVLFRTSEQGAVIDARPVGGPATLEKAAIDEIRRWSFAATLVNGQPVQMHSAVLLDFSADPPRIKAPGTMSAAQISPVLQFKCLNEELRQNLMAITARRRRRRRTRRRHLCTTIVQPIRQRSLLGLSS